METTAKFLRMFPFGFWVFLIILLTGILWIIFETKEAPAGKKLKGRGFLTFEQLWNEEKKENAALNSIIKLLERANETKFNEGYESGRMFNINAFDCRESIQGNKIEPQP
jgi:hypothetical protein